MRDFLLRTTRVAAIAGAALLVTACGGDSDEAANEAAANATDAGQLLDAPANDASAMEAAMNASEPAPPAAAGNQGTDSSDVLGNTSGGDTGGNTVESNVSGM